MSNWSYVIGAYGLTWIVLMGYVMHLSRRVGRARAALAREAFTEDRP